MPHSEAEQERQNDLIELEKMFDGILPAQQDDLEMLTCRVPRQKNQALKSWCKDNNISFADWVRARLYDAPLPRAKPAKRTSTLDRQIYIELNAIGVNLNQAVRRLNSQELPRLSLDDRNLLDHLLKKLNEIQQKLVE
ncbi:hypothetical protein H6F67_22265 [Microcoleus sp. FACHB-1515]|uniref:hypothetical protein n=1 Tax=Cyanophyceae TaxID=3028117 RepID=UPI001686AAA1|nr:hypothetical protein [Microcoleus sp. FACHB-1515]MBD2092577.1 hypothetical protein [Microcoleus sp. FACHB-1515]